MSKHEEREFRGFAVWRKDLCHLNKTRDNHFMRLGELFDLMLLVRSEADVREHIEIKGTKVVRIKTKTPGVLGLVEFYFKAFLCFRREHKKKNFDFILAPIGEEPIGALFRLLASNAPLLIYDLWDVPGLAITKFRITPKEISRRVYQWLLSKIIRNGDIVISGVVKDGLSAFQIPDNKIITTENGVLLDSFRPSDIQPDMSIWGRKGGVLKLLYVGYIHKTRGATDLIKLAGNLQKMGVSFHVLMIGPTDIDTVSETAALIRELGVGEHVTIHEPVPADRIPAIIASTDICLCPLEDIQKFRWSYPVKVYEYLAMGKPVIATESPGVSCLISDGANGYLYKSGDVDTLCGIISKLSEDPSAVSRLSENARKSVSDKDWGIVVPQLASKLTEKLSTNH